MLSSINRLRQLIAQDKAKTTSTENQLTKSHESSLPTIGRDTKERETVVQVRVESLGFWQHWPKLLAKERELGVQVRVESLGFSATLTKPFDKWEGIGCTGESWVIKFFGNIDQNFWQKRGNQVYKVRVGSLGLSATLTISATVTKTSWLKRGNRVYRWELGHFGNIDQNFWQNRGDQVYKVRVQSLGFWQHWPKLLAKEREPGVLGESWIVRFFGNIDQNFWQKRGNRVYRWELSH